MINQAVQQRNTQWAAEQTMFMTVVRPMLTFFEGFIYAITPIIAFIIVMGSFGVQLAGKYVQTILWIQLWMPVLSIINLFVHTAATNQMASLSANGLNSMYALSSSGDVLQHWIATGGMLAASTPIISLFIVSGSTYAFTSLASKIGGGDHVDEKLNTPDVLKQGPLDASSTGVQSKSIQWNPCQWGRRHDQHLVPRFEYGFRGQLLSGKSETSIRGFPEQPYPRLLRWDESGSNLLPAL